MQTRENVLHQWIKNLLGKTPYKLVPLAGDASFRCYYRLEYENLTRVIMDAPPEKESLEAFIHIAQILAKNGLHSPELFAINAEEGFILLEDLGNQLFGQAIKTEAPEIFYRTALSILLTMQKISTDEALLPAFDSAFMLKEMGLFQEWFLEAYLGLRLLPQESQLIQQSQITLAKALSKQPQVFIHRDYHSRNLMIIGHNEPPKLGIIDFQDAMVGPVTYDLVSLLKDCYVSWPRERVLAWVADFYSDSPNLSDYSLQDFIKAFDLCGLQRHLKVLGIFSRLALRDNKKGYLADLPLTLDYVLSCTETYEEFQPLHQFLLARVRLP